MVYVGCRAVGLVLQSMLEERRREAPGKLQTPEACGLGTSHWLATMAAATRGAATATIGAATMGATHADAAPAGASDTPDARAAAPTAGLGACSDSRRRGSFFIPQYGER